MHNSKKSLSDSHLIKQNFKEIQSRLSDYQHIYTDGSKAEDKVGCAYISGSHHEKIRLPDGSSIFTAESKAIDMALDYIMNNSLENKFVIFSDSLCGLKKATIEMIRKDWKKQQQKERQARSQSSPPTKETKSKSSQGTQRPSTSNRERKGSNNVIQQHNRFGSLSDSSDDMELGEAPDRPRTNRNRSRSSEHSHVNNSNNRSKSPITYP